MEEVKREELKKLVKEMLKEIIREEGLKVGDTTYIKNDVVHISAATPKVQLEGAETDGKNLSIRENAGAIELYDEAGGARIYNLYPKKTASATLTIPIGGGSVTGSITAADLGLSSIDYVVSLRVKREVPIVDDVYQVSYGLNAGLDAVGITVAAGTGTTLTVEAEAGGAP